MQNDLSRRTTQRFFSAYEWYKLYLSKTERFKKNIKYFLEFLQIYRTNYNFVLLPSKWTIKYI